MTDRAKAHRPRQSRRGFAGLLTANFVSMLGTRMSALALPWFVLVTTGSPAETGLVVFAEMAPYVLVQGFGGPLVDRYGTWRVSILTDAIAAVAFGLVPTLYMTGTLGLGTIVALVAVVGAVRGAGDTARRVLVPGLADDAGTALERASGWYDAISRAASMIGAPAAGVLIALISAPAVLAVDAATFVVSALVVALAVPPSAQRSRMAAAEVARAGSEAEASYLASLKEGFAHLAADRLLLGIAGMVLVTNLVDQAFSAVLAPVWANSVTGSPVVLGAMGAAMGVGALAGNGTVAWLGP
ncbi:MAG TPA: MFS transporter, partial [Candidatus Limnocylindrales bacterium]